MLDFFDLDPIVDMVNPSMGVLELIFPLLPLLSLLTYILSRALVLPSDEDLLESMVKVHEHSSLSVSSSLKMKQITMSIVLFLCQAR
jgi:hypothetical protein